MAKHVDGARFLVSLGLQFGAGLLATSVGKPTHLYGLDRLGVGLMGGATIALLGALPAKRRPYVRPPNRPAPKTLIGERRTTLLTLSFALILVCLFLLIGLRAIPLPKPQFAFLMVGLCSSIALSQIYSARTLQARVEEHNRWLAGMSRLDS